MSVQVALRLIFPLELRVSVIETTFGPLNMEWACIAYLGDRVARGMERAMERMDPNGAGAEMGVGLHRTFHGSDHEDALASGAIERFGRAGE